MAEVAPVISPLASARAKLTEAVGGAEAGGAEVYAPADMDVAVYAESSPRIDPADMDPVAVNRMQERARRAHSDDGEQSEPLSDRE
eukprot:984528-Prorocentrum_minimum.AAC.2